MRRWSPALLAVTLGAIVCGLIGYAAEQVPGKAPATGTGQPTKAASRPPRDAHAADIVWFGNTIETAAIRKLLKATDKQAQLQRIAAILEESRIALTPFAEVGCRWACPPGMCSPDCRPKNAFDPTGPFVDPELLQQLGIGPTIVHLYVATLENLALDAPSGSYEKVVTQLRGTVDKIGNLP